jgi:hypothetical protein
VNERAGTIATTIDFTPHLFFSDYSSANRGSSATADAVKAIRRGLLHRGRLVRIRIRRDANRA